MRKQAGLFDRRITIQSKTETTGALTFGNPTFTWSTFAQPWAARRVLRGQERFSAMQCEAKVEAIFELRHPVASLMPEMRVKDGTRLYDITAIIEAERTGGGQ